jgi:predicted phage-related endonuclease
MVMPERVIRLGAVSAASERRAFIGGSDARIIMSNDEKALLRLWREKRGEAEQPDYSDNLLVQLGLATEPLNRLWYERTTGNVIKDVQSWVRHPLIRWMAATLDGVVESTGAVFEAKFMLPWSFSEEVAAAKHMPQVQHNMWVTNATAAVLSIITGGAKWLEIKISADPLYQHLLLTAEKKFWRCVESGEPPRLFGAEPPRSRGGGPHRRHELVKRVGGILQCVSADQRRLPRAREREGGAQGPHAGGRQRGHRPRDSSQAFKIRRRKL